MILFIRSGRDFWRSIYDFFLGLFLIKAHAARVRSMSLFKGAEGSGLRQNDNAFCNNEGDPDFRQDRNP
jgi:hypothetical protein